MSDITYRWALPEDAEAIVALQRKEKARRDMLTGVDTQMFIADPSVGVNALTLVAEKDGKLVGCVVARMTCEPMMYLDHSDPSFEPTEKWNLIQNGLVTLSRQLQKIGLGEIHLFPDDPKWADRLKTLPGVVDDKRKHLVLILETMTSAANARIVELESANATTDVAEVA